MIHMRTDIHRPSAINPDDYRFVAFECIKIEGLGDCHIQLANREIIRAHMASTGGTYSRHAHGGNCMVCGNANAIYTALFYHEPTNTYVRMGADCADKVEMGLDRAAFTRFRDGVYQHQEARAGKRKAEAFLNEHGLSEAWVIFTANWEDLAVTQTDSNGSYKTLPYEENTITDIVSKLVRYGSISDKQTAFVANLLGKIKDRAKIKAEREAEEAAAQPIPEEILGKRATVSGTVLSVKIINDDYNYGFRKHKMLVKTDAGWKLWTSVPAMIDTVERGQRVEFDAKIERSKDNAKFGFGSRPTKARILESATLDHI